MLERDQHLTELEALAASEMAKHLESAPVKSSKDLKWECLTLQRWQFGSREIRIPPMCDHVVSLQLGGPVLMEVELGQGCNAKRWFEPGSINVIPAGEPAKRLLKGRSDVLTLSLAPQVVEAVFMESFDRDSASLSLRTTLAEPDESIRRLCLLLAEEVQNGEPTSAMMADTISRALALQLIRRHSNFTSMLDRPTPSLPVGRIRRVIEYMRSHLEDDLRLAVLADQVGLSQSQFARAFREATGMPPHRYLTSLRIAKARHLLEQSTMTVTEVGATCGFQQSAHFSTSFRCLSGMSPRAWRQARTA